MGIGNWIAGKLGVAAEKLEARGRARMEARGLSRTYRRAYSAAAIDRLTADWKFPETTADVETYHALKILRGRSRDLFRNDDYMKRFANLLKTNVVGPEGVRLQAAAMDAGGKLDRGANKKIEKAWAKWGTPLHCSVCGTLSLWDIANQVIESCAQDGEILVQMVPGINEFGLALKLIEADHLDLTRNEVLPNGNRIVMGVELDPYRRRVAYWLLTRHPGDPYSMQSNTSERYPAQNFLHIFKPDRPGQTRAVPWVVTAMQRLKQLGAYEEAELIASRIAASKMGFFIPEEGSEYLGEDEEGTGDDIDVITSAEPGTFEKLPAKMQFQSWDPEHPVAAFEQFEKAVLRGIASGLNVSYVSLANNLEGVSYSSIRSGELQDRDAWRMLQRWLIERLYQPVFERWLAMALTTQALQLPIGKHEKFREVRWKPRGWNWVDPAKESASAANDVKNGFKSLFDVAAERGYDLEEILEENARARDLAKQYGLILPVFSGDKINGKTEQRPNPQAEN